jgi:hypothetical protein
MSDRVDKQTLSPSSDQALVPNEANVLNHGKHSLNGPCLLLWSLMLLKLSSTAYLKNFVVYLRLLHLVDAKRLRKHNLDEESQAPNFDALGIMMSLMNRLSGSMSPSFVVPWKQLGSWLVKY